MEVSQVAAAITVSFTVLTGLFGLGWWLKSQFSDVKSVFYQEIEKHEVTDQLRHDDNLRRFEKINISVAKLETRIEGNDRRSRTRDDNGGFSGHGK